MNTDLFPTFSNWQQRAGDMAEAATESFADRWGRPLFSGLIFAIVYGALFFFSSSTERIPLWLLAAGLFFPSVVVLSYLASPQGKKCGYAPTAFKGFLLGLRPTAPAFLLAGVYTIHSWSTCSNDGCLGPAVLSYFVPVIPLAGGIGGLIRYIMLRSEARETAALQPLLDAANRCDTAAMAELGERYYSGDGIGENPHLAARWLERASDAGHAGARARLGWLYYEGKGASKDAGLALKLWQETETEQQAQLGLGVLYYNGEGVETSGDKAFEWWTKAAAQGNEIARKNLEELARIRERR